MAFNVYVTGYETGTTVEDLIIYFQSKESGGGDIDEEACQFNEEEAVIAFDEEEDQKRVLKTPQTLEGTKLTVTEKYTKKKEIQRKTKEDSTNKNPQSVKKDDKKPQIGAIATVIVSGISPGTTDNTLNNFFQNKRRSGGGEIKHFDRVRPDIAHVTFFSPEVAKDVLEKGKFEVDGYLLNLQPKKSEVIFPPDKKKLFIENIDPKATKDNLISYVELITDEEVVDLHMGNNNDAMVTLNNELDINKVTEQAKRKQLENVAPKITHPPVCNNALVTGISKNTTKDALVLKFENPKYGGGEILDVIYQQNEGKAVISFLDPSVIDTISRHVHNLNDSTLTTRPCYPFMENKVVDETINEAKIIQVNEDVMNHVSNRCDKEFSELFGFSASELKYDGNNKEVTISGKNDIHDKIVDYFNQFEVRKIPILESLMTGSKDELQTILAEAKEMYENMTWIQFDEEKKCIVVMGKKKEVKICDKNIEKKLDELSKIKKIITRTITLDQNKLMLMHSLGFEELFRSQPNIDAKIKSQENTIELKGSKDLVDDAKVKALEEYSKMKEDYVEVNKRQEKFLASGGLNQVNKHLKDKRIKAIMCLNQSKQGKAKVVFIDTEKSEEILRFVSDEIFEKSCVLENESEQILESEGWTEEEKKLSNEFGVQIVISENQENNTDVWLIGEKTNVERAFPCLKKFIEINTIVNESVTFDEGTSRYLMEHCQGKIYGIERSQKEQMVKIKSNGDRTFTLQGTKNGAKDAIKKLKDIAESLAFLTITIEQPGMQRFFKSKAGKASLLGIESELHCVITVTNDKESRPMEVRQITDLPIPSGAQLLCTYKTPEKILLNVYQSDITNHTCDVIVNAANGDLRHAGGLARAIVEKGGKEIQDDCDHYLKKHASLLPGEIYKGIPGRLPCKSIIHMVGQTWDKFSRAKHEDHLRYACEKALESAKSDKTIAIPAVGSGIYGVPKNVCARALVDAAMKFSSTEGRKGSLEEIHFVNNDGPTAQAFLSEFKKRFSDEPNFVEKSSAKKIKQKGTVDYEETTSFDPPEPPRRPLNGDCITTKTQAISVVVGDLATHKADVLVNTTSEDLNLKNNPCGRALGQEAGPSLQKECNKVGRLKVGEVALTAGGKLYCKHVCHVVCTQYNNGQGEKVLRSVITSCLKKSESRGHTSIAFPSIGTGVLGFPHKIAAKIFFEEVKQFAKKNPKTSVKDVRFVVYHQDQSSIKAFKEELKNQPEWNQPSSVSKSSDPSRRELRKPVVSAEKKPRTTTTVNDKESGGMKVPLKDGGMIYVLRGDITEETTDVIAHLSNPDGSMNGGVAQGIIKKGGKEIAKMRAKEKEVPVYKAVLTKAGNLPAKYIAHMAGPNGANSQDIKKCIATCLEEVINQKCKSVSFPAIGTGQLSMSPENSAKAMLTAIVEFLENKPGSINTVRIIIQDQEVFEKFSKQVASDDERLLTTLTVNDEEDGGIKVSLKDGGIIYVLGGDITEERTDVIAHLSNPDGSMNGGVAQAIIKKGGEEIGKLRAKEKKALMFKAVLTKAGKLPTNYVAHMAGPNRPDFNDIKKCIANCLEEVMKQQCKSISFPAIGTGQLSRSSEDSAKAMLTAIVEFLENNPGSINTVRIIIQDQEVFENFKKAVKKLVSTQDDQSPELSRSIGDGNWTDYFKLDSKATTTIDETTMINRPLFLKAYTEQKSTIDEVKEKIAIMTKEQMKQKKVQDDQIEKLSEAQVTKINDIGKKNSVHVKIERKSKRIIVDGHSEDVSTVLLKITSILNEIKIIAVPDYWNPQPKDANGKEQPVHVVQLDPTNAKHQKEYKKVSDGFNLTASSHTITKIERIQNPALYKLYALKKQNMDKRYGSNEKILYHGTATRNVASINQNGLNRNYKGENGTAYGQGIYFATTASMSAGYAAADSSGKRTMYVARVAVGKYTKSDPAMIVPPKLPGSPNDSHDSVVNNVANPTIFVMFYDNQYYPEYLITFS